MMNRFNLLLEQLTFFQPVYTILYACMCAGRIIPHVAGAFVPLLPFFVFFLASSFSTACVYGCACVCLCVCVSM